MKLAQAGVDSCPSYPSALRYLKAHGLPRRRPPRRDSKRPWEVFVGLREREIRSYEVEYVLQLLHLDFHHGSRKVLTREGRWVNPLLVGFIDDRQENLWSRDESRLLAMLEGESSLSLAQPGNPGLDHQEYHRT